MNYKDVTLGKLYKVQADEDDTLEQGRPVYFNQSKTSCFVVGTDPDDPEGRQGFIGMIGLDNILECIEPTTPIARTSRVTITGTGLIIVEE